MKRVAVAERGHMRAADIAIPLEQVPTAASGDPLVDLLPRLGISSDGRALVFDGDQLVGIVSPSDIARRMQLGELRVMPPRAA
jgi:CBS domain-containing protein